MKLTPFVFSVTIFLNFSSVSFADIQTDGSAGKVDNLSGTMTIPQSLGKTVGHNLFHSFKNFSVNTGESATFTGANALRNVISRVTGGAPSVVDGLLKSSIPNADFYFINPAGIAFGANAQVNVPNGFHVSTANKLTFDNGAVFNVDTNAIGSSFGTANPESFGFLGNQSGDISIQDSKLTFKEKSLVTLSANNIDITKSSLLNSGGEFRLFAVGSNATDISLNSTPNDFLSGTLTIDTSLLKTDNDLEGQKTENIGQILLNSNSLTLKTSELHASNTGMKDGSKEGKGIKIDSKTIKSNNSRIIADTSSTGNGSDIIITSDNFSMEGGEIRTLARGSNGQRGGDIKIKSNQFKIGGDNEVKEVGIFTRTLLGDKTGNKNHAGNVVITTDDLQISEGGQINTSTNSEGDAGYILILDTASLSDNNTTVTLSDKGSGIFSNAEKDSEGKAGNITIFTNDLSMANGGKINSSTFGQGNAGTVNIQNNTLKISGSDSGIFSNAEKDSEGKAGDITLYTKNLSLLEGGKIKSNTVSKGDAGKITINNTGTIFINGEGRETGFFTDSTGKGKGGDITLNGGTLKILKGGIISSSIFSSGNSGVITINNNALEIDGLNNGGRIVSNSEGTGNGGNINIKSKKVSIFKGGLISSYANSSGISGEISLDIDGDLTIDGKNSKITNDAKKGSTGDANNLTITAETLNILNGSSISSSTLGTGKAGKVVVNSPKILINNAGIFSNAEKESKGNAGDITVISEDLKVLKNGKISSSTAGLGKAGTVDINTNTLLIKNSKISSASEGDKSSGETGNIIIKVKKKLTLSDKGKISIENGANLDDFSQAKTIEAGTITIAAPDMEMKDSNITAESTGNVAAGNIKLQFKENLMMDNTLIETTAKTGNGGDIIVIGDDLVNLKDSGFKTSVEGEKSNGGNINLTANRLMMETGVIQANAKGGDGGEVKLDTKILLTSGGMLTRGGKNVDWKPFKHGGNVIQAASENGLSGTVNITAPEVDVADSINVLNTKALAVPDIDPCINNTKTSSFVAKAGKGGMPTNESNDFVPLSPRPPATNSPLSQVDKEGNSFNFTPIKLVKDSKKSPCSSL